MSSPDQWLIGVRCFGNTGSSGWMYVRAQTSLVVGIDYHFYCARYSLLGWLIGVD